MEQTVKQRFEVKRSSADKNCSAAATLDLVNNFRGLIQPPSNAAGFRRLQDVNQMVRDLIALGESRLGSADIEAAIERHCVHCNDLGVQSRGEFERERRLARAG